MKSERFECVGQRSWIVVPGDFNKTREGGLQQTVRRVGPSHEVIEEVECEVTSHGCAIQEIQLSPSGRWFSTGRTSGQGEWGYDVFRTSPLGREAGLLERKGYMLEPPRFSTDETRVVGGYGTEWLGGWWAHPDDEMEEPARGGRIQFGFLFVHHLPSHEVQWHELQMEIPEGWLPDDSSLESPLWYAATDITPVGEGVTLTLPGGIHHEISGPLPSTILLPTPHPAGGRLI